jgi:hypothetical protein
LAPIYYRRRRGRQAGPQLKAVVRQAEADRGAQVEAGARHCVRQLAQRRHHVRRRAVHVGIRYDPGANPTTLEFTTTTPAL